MKHVELEITTIDLLLRRGRRYCKDRQAQRDISRPSNDIYLPVYVTICAEGATKTDSPMIKTTGRDLREPALLHLRHWGSP